MSGNLVESPELSFTTLGTPAAFSLSSLDITPMEVDIGESVTVSVVVTNTGDLEGTYEVTLRIDGVVVATQEVTLAAGASQTVTFTVAEDVAGTYTVGIDGFSDTFVVKTIRNWWLIGGIIAAVVAAGLVTYLFFIRRGVGRKLIYLAQHLKKG